MSPNRVRSVLAVALVVLDMADSFAFLSSHCRPLRIYGDWDSLQRKADVLSFSHSDSVTDGTAEKVLRSSAQQQAQNATRHARSQSLVDFGSKREQLWLDLRGTAVFPHEALQLLKEQCSSGGNAKSQTSLDESVLHLIDGVLVSQEMFERIAEHESLIIGKQSYLLLYATDNTQELVANAASAQMSIPVGKIVTVSEKQTDSAIGTSSSSIDPVLALDVVIDRKQWLLIDSNHRIDLEESALKFKGRVASLLQFVSASTRSSAASDRVAFSSSGLIFPGLAGSSTENSVSGSKTGGVAIACPDQNTFIKMDSLLAEFRSSLQTTTTTESGLLVPSQSPADTETSGTLHDAASLPATALVLPLDLRVWKTALALRRMIHEAGEADVFDLLL